MHVNHRYLLHCAEEIAASKPGVRILDYGCGGGEIVAAGRRCGLDIVGAEVFFDGGSSRLEAQATGLLGTMITEIHQGRLEYGDGVFDLVITNQVIEHVADLDAVLTEISRVMKPHSMLVSIFPTKEVLREGHVGIPLVHWFAKDSRCRLPYALAFRALGFGHFKRDKSVRQWSTDALAWLDKYTFYRTRADTLKAFRKHFVVTEIEPHYAHFRIAYSLHLDSVPSMSRIREVPWVSTAVRASLHRLTGVVLLAEKTEKVQMVAQ
jgi:SAM-dependent methyltransferase